MRKANITRCGLAVATIMALFMFAPAESDSITDGVSFFGIQDACAQTGSCMPSAGAICFVNGVPYPEREWVGGSCRNRADDCIPVEF